MNKKTIVVYTSKTGFTKKYAGWIKETLNCTMKELSDTSIAEMLEYDTIIYGGGLRASQIMGIKKIKKNIEQLAEKKLLVFGVGLVPGTQKYTEELAGANIPKEYQPRVPLFYFRGGLDLDQYGFLTKKFMTFMKKKVDEADGAGTDGKSKADYTDKRYIEELISQL